MWITHEMPLIKCKINLILTRSGSYFINSRSCKLLQQLKSAFKRIINWKKYLGKPELLVQNLNLNGLVEPSFQ